MQQWFYSQIKLTRGFKKKQQYKIIREFAVIKFGTHHSLVRKIDKKRFQGDIKSLLWYLCFEDFFDGIQNCYFGLEAEMLSRNIMFIFQDGMVENFIASCSY
jgi:hypothetical protein